jgi:hypothetical protein
MGHLDDLLRGQAALRKARSPSTSQVSRSAGAAGPSPTRVDEADSSAAETALPHAGVATPSTVMMASDWSPDDAVTENRPDVASRLADDSGPGPGEDGRGRCPSPPPRASQSEPGTPSVEPIRLPGRGPLAAARDAYDQYALRPSRPVPLPDGPLKMPKYVPSPFPDWPAARRSGTLPATNAAGAPAVLRGTKRQQDFARRVKPDLVRRILAVLNLLIGELGEGADHADHAREAALAAQNRLDAKWWIENRQAPIGPIVGELLWWCRDEAYYRAAIRRASAWREGLAGMGERATPQPKEDPFERARRVGYAVIGTTFDLGEIAHRRWCDERSLPFVVVNTSGRYPWNAGTVAGAEHALVSLRWPRGRWSVSAEERAELEAACAVCAPPGDATSRVSVSRAGVHAIVPRALAAPLAARLFAIATPPVAGDDADGASPRREEHDAEPRPDAASPDPRGQSTPATSPTMIVRRRPRSARPRPDELPTPLAETGMDPAPPAGSEQVGEGAGEIVRKHPKAARPGPAVSD